MQWPPDYHAEFDRRGRLLNRLRQDYDLRGDFMLHYKHNFTDWVKDWCVTFDPRVVPPLPRVMPFILFPRQVQFGQFLTDCLHQKRHGLGEKARDMGVTWECCAFAVHQWLFWAGTAIGWGSRKEEYVDRLDDPKAIFPKMRQIIEYLPKWQLPRGFDPKRHSSYMRLINPENGSSIVGEAGDNIGRGARTTMYFKDESSHYERPESVEAALGDTTDVQIDISSVNGSANVFYRRRMAGTLWEPGKVLPAGATAVFIFDWRDHPGKTQEWYDMRRAKAEAEGLLHVFAQEVDRDYSGSVEGIIIRPEWIRAALDAHVKLADWGNWSSGEHTAGQDIADGGGDRNAYASRHGAVLKRLAQWAGEAGPAARIAVPMCVEDAIKEIHYDCIGVGAGFKTESNTMQAEAAWPKSLRVVKWDASAKPDDPTGHIIPGDDQSPTNEDHYLNYKAQAYFRLRARFWKTYCAVTKGERCDVGEMISLPSTLEHVHEAVMELAQPVKKTSVNGKTMVDKKPDGSRSPNLSDAISMAFNPVRDAAGFFDM
jgi:phage terminase large subunit